VSLPHVSFPCAPLHPLSRTDPKFSILKHRIEILTFQSHTYPGLSRDQHRPPSRGGGGNSRPTSPESRADSPSAVERSRRGGRPAFVPTRASNTGPFRRLHLPAHTSSFLPFFSPSKSNPPSFSKVKFAACFSHPHPGAATTTPQSRRVRRHELTNPGSSVLAAFARRPLHGR
jgi:hypothetical protein